MQEFWQAYYQVLPIISAREFIKLNAHMDMITKTMKYGIKYKDCRCCAEHTNVEYDLPC